MTKKIGRPTFVGDTVLDIARKNHGVVTVEDCKAAGIEPATLRKFVQRNKDKFAMRNFSKGIYLLYKDPNEEINHSYTGMFARIKQFGSGAFLFGDSVLAYHDIAYALPIHEMVAVKKKYLIAKPPVRTVFYPSPKTDEVEVRDGIPMQTVRYALVSTLETPKRYLLEGAHEALQKGLVNNKQFVELVSELR